MLPQEHGPSNQHRVGVIIPVLGSNDNRWIQFAARRLSDWFGNNAVDWGTLIMDNGGDQHLMPAVMVYSDVTRLSDLTLARVYGLGMTLDAQAARIGIGVMIDGDVFIL